MSKNPLEISHTKEILLNYKIITIHFQIVQET